MAFVHVDDVLADRDLAETMDPALVALLARLADAARAGGDDQSEEFDTFTVTVSARGDIDVDVSAPNAFADWVWAAGDLAHHVGPRHGEVNGETRSVDDILGSADDTGDEDAAADETDDDSESPGGAAGAAPFHEVRDGLRGPAHIEFDPAALSAPSPYNGPHWAPWSAKAAGAPPVASAAMLEVYLCTGCAAVSDEPADFEGAPGVLMRCGQCGAAVVTRRAVQAGGTLLLLTG